MVNYTSAHLDMLARLLAGEVMTQEEISQLKNYQFLSKKEKLTAYARGVINSRRNFGDARFMED